MTVSEKRRRSAARTQGYGIGVLWAGFLIWTDGGISAPWGVWLAGVLTLGLAFWARRVESGWWGRWREKRRTLRALWKVQVKDGVAIVNDGLLIIQEGETWERR